MSYVYAGTCPQVVDGMPITLQENQVLLLDTNCPHSIEELGEGDIMISLVLEREFLRTDLLGTFAHESILSQFFVNALNDQTDHNRYVRFHAEHSRRVRRYFQEIMCEYYDPSSNAVAVLLNLLQLLFAELITVYEQDFIRRDENHGAVSVVPIIRYIETHYRTCTLESVAEHFAVSPNYVTTLLKRHTGMTYMQAVQAQRLGRAASLLRGTDRTVENIAHEVGYENLSFFYRKFRAQYGCLPTAYRARYHAGPR
ncbi:MAG TPA: helix-turn-helix domain-containing protein [Candidatus Coprousia avicola]|nr:helix-turn-helix domain-containing protein [Candidatus Coprousia avicola]